MTRTVPLSQGKVALVDDADYERVIQFKWHAEEDLRTWYARRNIWVGSPGARRCQAVLMHRFIMGLLPRDNIGDKREVAHLNGDGLDNRRVNLQVTDHKTNMQTVRLRRNSKSGMNGVTWDLRRGKWHARIGSRTGGKETHLGYFADPETAKAARLSAQIQMRRNGHGP